MNRKIISSGVVHSITPNIHQLLTSKPNVLEIWESITPLARNEWICWIESAKKQETKDRRMRIMCEKLLSKMHRPCCWPGCPHRK